MLVNPNANALLHAAHAADFKGLAGELAERLSAFVGPGGIRRRPDVVLKAIEDRQHHSNVLEYLYHPAKLSHVHVWDWDRSSPYGRAAAAKLNLNLQEYLYAVTAFSFDRHTVRYAGNLDSHRREFIRRG